MGNINRSQPAVSQYMRESEEPFSLNYGNNSYLSIVDNYTLELQHCPVVYTRFYNMNAGLLGYFHPFDGNKFGNVFARLVKKWLLTPNSVVEPAEVNEEDLLHAHTAEYLNSLKSSGSVARIIEIPLLWTFSMKRIDNHLLRPMKYQTGGTVLASKLALSTGWAINIGGGFHHASSDHGEGFCVYADISLAIKYLLSRGLIKSALIVDLDAHQGNGHERDFLGDQRITIFDMYNCEIYPCDTHAKGAIKYDIRLRCGASDVEYLNRLQENLQSMWKNLKSKRPGILLYNAGTDCYKDDRLGRLNISAEAIIQRDEMLFRFANVNSVPIVMLIRNLNRTEGQSNGTRVIIKELLDHLLIGIILTGERKGDIILIPRITFVADDPKLPFKFHRHQFPVKLAFAMTINKSQGQTFKFVGLNLINDVFSHGQLYVAASRVRKMAHLKIQLNPDREHNMVKNVVFKELLEE